MNKEIVCHLTDEFVDLEGLTHKFIIVAVTNRIDPVAINNNEVVKELSLGYAICNPEDSESFNEEEGIKIAYRKACSRKNKCKMYSTLAGMFNTPMVTTLLRQEAEYFKQNPGCQIKGYFQYYERKKKREAKEQFINSLPENERAAADALIAMSPEVKKKLISIIS